MYQAGLVLEGGGMKGVYTAGVLDYFLEQGLEFANNYGVSAGAIMLCSFVSKQKKRSLRIYVDYVNDKRYCSIYSLLTTGDLFGAKFCYDEIPNKLIPFDYDTYHAFPGRVFAVVTDIETGEPEYLPMKEMHADIQAVRASASMPLVSRTVKINGKRYLDGGMSDAIPIRKSLADGNPKSVIVLTKEVGYQRKRTSAGLLLRLRYPFHKKLVNRMLRRHEDYNGTLAFIAAEEAAGRAFVIRPRKKSEVGRIEKNPKKLKALYQEGYEDAKACYPALLRFLAGAPSGAVDKPEQDSCKGKRTDNIN